LTVFPKRVRLRGQVTGRNFKVATNYRSLTMNIPQLKYDTNGLSLIIQDAENNEVLMMAYMNATSLEKTIETGYTYFWSRSRQKYWKKGETSGHVQEVKLFSMTVTKILS
jgi:phosphoribosyl-AMP cyclohydrolase